MSCHLFIYGIIHYMCVQWGEGGLDFCYVGACILLNDPCRLVVFILNEAGFVMWLFLVEKIQFYFFGLSLDYLIVVGSLG